MTFEPLTMMRAIRDDATLNSSEKALLFAAVLRTDNDTCKVRFAVEGLAVDASMSPKWAGKLIKRPQVARYFSKTETWTRNINLWFHESPASIPELCTNMEQSSGIAEPDDSGTLCPDSGTLCPDSGTLCPDSGTLCPDSGTEFPPSAITSAITSDSTSANTESDSNTPVVAAGTAAVKENQNPPMDSLRSSNDPQVASLPSGHKNLEKVKESESYTSIARAKPAVDGLGERLREGEALEKETMFINRDKVIKIIKADRNNDKLTRNLPYFPGWYWTSDRYGSMRTLYESYIEFAESHDAIPAGTIKQFNHMLSAFNDAVQIVQAEAEEDKSFLDGLIGGRI